MQLGSLRLTTVPGGRFRLDGGAMFGVVPKPLWSRLAVPDEKNRIPLATNCVLVETGTHRALIDTGFGTKLSEKERHIYDVDDAGTLLGNLKGLGLSPQDIDLVILSHLHFDHAGGGTVLDGGEPRPAFPRAKYCVQRREWEAAVSGRPEWQGTYPPENFACLEAAGQLSLLDGDQQLLPGIRVLWTGGHSPGHQVIVLEDPSQTDGSQRAVYLGDLCPTWNHLPRMWCMGYDEEVVVVRRRKPELLKWLAEEQSWLLSDHDPDLAAVRIAPDARRDFVVVDSRERL